MDFLPDSGEDFRCESAAYDDKAAAPDTFSGIQGQGGAGRDQKREAAGRTGATVRCPSQPDQQLEKPVAGRRGTRFGQEKSDPKAAAVDLKGLHAKIGERAPGVSRSSVYDMPRPVPAKDLMRMRRLDELRLDYPFAGARMLLDLLRREGVAVGRRHVSTRTKRTGLKRSAGGRTRASRRLIIRFFRIFYAR